MNHKDKKEMGGLLECGGCRVRLKRDLINERWYCPRCEYIRE